MSSSDLVKEKDVQEWLQMQDKRFFERWLTRSTLESLPTNVFKRGATVGEIQEAVAVYKNAFEKLSKKDIERAQNEANRLKQEKRYGILVSNLLSFVFGSDEKSPVLICVRDDGEDEGEEVDEWNCQFPTDADEERLELADQTNYSLFACDHNVDRTDEEDDDVNAAFNCKENVYFFAKNDEVTGRSFREKIDLVRKDLEKQLQS